MSNLPLNSPLPDDRVTTIACLYCGRPQEVGRKAMSVTCKFCHKPLRIQDLQYAKYEARRSIDTCGVVTVEKKGNVVVTERIMCGGAVIRGKVKGNIESRGPVLVGPEAEIKGDVTAPALAVGAGAILEGQYRIGERQGDGEPAATRPQSPSRG
jgi:hypothetical protein